MSDENDKPNLRPGPGMIILFILALGIVIAGTTTKQVTTSKIASEEAQMTSVTTLPDASFGVDAIAPSSPAAANRVEKTLLPQERDNWQEDPSSYGFNDDDREFLQEYGVSESEARAAETILRENGVD